MHWLQSFLGDNYVELLVHSIHSKARGCYWRARAAHELAKLELERQENLSARQVSSAAELDRARSEERAAFATHKEARASLADGGRAPLWRRLEQRRGRLTVQLEQLPLAAMREAVAPAVEGATAEEAEPADDWEARLSSIEAAIADGTCVPPPIIMTNLWGEGHTLADGKLRRAALLRTGAEKYWALTLTVAKDTNPPAP